MGIDLSRSIQDSLQKVLQRARTLAGEGNNVAAADAYERCAGLTLRFAEFAVTTPEKVRRTKQAQEYRRLAADLRDRPAPMAAATPRADVTALDDEADEYRAAAAALIQTASVGWDDIGGLTDVKNQIRMAYALALAGRPDGVKLQGGRNILFYGPPGTGKTLLAAATSRELEATFFNVKTSNVLSKYFGESSKLIEAVYALAREKAPSVVFFDEFDSLSASRDAAGSAGAERRVVATLLSELDGLSEKGGDAFVMTLAATNLPWTLDPAIMSRLDQHVYVPLPDATVRGEILDVLFRKRGCEFAGDRTDLIASTDGMAGRRLAQVVEAATRQMVTEMNPGMLAHVDKGREAVEAYQLKVRPLTMADFQTGLAGVSRQDDSLTAKYDAWRRDHAPTG